MIPASFDYDVAESVDHALELLGNGDAKLLAGGHSLIPALKLRIARPERLVDIGRLDELAYVRDAGAEIAIGALTCHTAVASAPLLQEHCPIVSYTAARIGDPQVRHRGTIGGSLAHGDPASDLPAVMLAVGAELVIRGEEGERTVPASEFFTGVFETAVGPAEMLTEIRVPKLGDSAGWAYLKAQRRAQDWATVGVAAIVRRTDGDGRERVDRPRQHGRHAAARTAPPRQRSRAERPSGTRPGSSPKERSRRPTRQGRVPIALTSSPSSVAGHSKKHSHARDPVRLHTEGAGPAARYDAVWPSARRFASNTASPEVRCRTPSVWRRGFSTRSVRRWARSCSSRGVVASSTCTSATS